MKQLFLGLLAVLTCLFAMPSLQAYSLPGSIQLIAVTASPNVQSSLSSDTLLLKRKVYYGDKKLKNPRELEAVLKTANDAETMALFKKFKTTITLANVLIIPVCIVAIPLLISSRGKLKKTIQRFNDVTTGRVKP